ncbi:hypothetical protein [Paenibacillus apiarius]|nr:hypothetical protein [Paenibacillus apiarius]MEC0118704.1 hypothetical protein [Paenibacillus apiarius]MEC0193254.1 hypothetical protein [Paenibacillus apiarius]
MRINGLTDVPVRLTLIRSVVGKLYTNADWSIEIEEGMDAGERKQ